MKTAKAIFYFYVKILVPSLVISLVASFISGFSLKTFAISYPLFSLGFHYMIYELRNKNEYYFYQLLGLSRQILWIITASISVVVFLIIYS